MAFPALFLDVQTAVADKLRLNLADDGQRIQDWINQTYADVAAETRCFQQTSVATMTPGVGSYTLDSSVLHIELLTVKQVGGQAFYPLVECQLDEILNLRAANPVVTGPAKRYCVVGISQIEFYPAPATADTLNTWYSHLPVPLTQPNDPILLPEPYASKTLEFGALVQGAEWKRDLMMLGDFQQQYATWLASFQRYLNRKAGAYPGAFPTWTRKGPPVVSDVSADHPGV